MKMQPAQFGAHTFSITRIYDATIDAAEGELIFEIELRLRHVDQRFFFGILCTPGDDQPGAVPVEGIGVSVNPRDGEVADVINEQGVIGILEQVPMELNESVFLCLAVEKLNRILIPKLTVGEERILHPALHLERCSRMSLVVGTTDTARGAVFENPHFVVSRRHPRISA